MSRNLEIKLLQQDLVAETLNKGISNNLPRHFVESTLPRIGGGVTGVYDNGMLIGCGFSFPTITSGGKLSYITRGYRLPGNEFNFPNGWLDVEKFATKQISGETLASKNGFKINHPNNVQAESAMGLQKKVWGENAALYPHDLYFDGSGADTRLVAIDNVGDTIGFLLGFIGFGEKWKGTSEGDKTVGFWVESQIAAVDNDYKENGVAKALKWEQYDQAEKRGLKLIHWTVDPLQVKNAGLNYGLGAVAAEFTPNYYSFRNEKNIVTASRFGVYWLVGSDRANKAKEGRLKQNKFEDFLTNESEIINPLQIFSELDDWVPTTKNILIEIPIDWDKVQHDELELALKWREASDNIYSKIIGIGKGKYVITGRVFDGETPYLIAQRFEYIYK